ncbi:TIGR03546 family protein [Francisella tularensis subsp. holarctica]|uniref:TIGR03546 family protein n=1 Tax=Francisella tularensis TaxID=263 RepID=UPI000F42B831|nr:TIGR03546 family protein [Francisella tularensis]MBZ5743887.1 TIGR03546 family protein [Francisella tularensis]RNI21457.1 TIGR03546 family protein [Francisella tularensis subsp. holarctica]RNI36790.1 TIGR03546 family protein [Francisella tularensis subsp. holarctica]RNI36873.1 TIGR03546 family protein [Francisella tularensis subsp. holarctica]RNI42296.1 TIGR03546 family protein [Francisella tularensis subsp. holarctica]
MFDYIFNKIKATVFSKITPAQLLLTAILAFVFGFVPGIAYSPLLFIGVLFLVIILRINIGVFVFIAIIAKALSYILQGISFAVGTFLLDGFTQPLFKTLVNTPVVAYAGFDYYLVTGAFVVAIVLGVIFGVIIAKFYKKIVAKMAAIQFGTELYNKITKNFFVKIAGWIFLGKNIAKVNWVEMQNRKFRQPFRLTGVILVALIIAVLIYSPKLLEMSLVSNIIKQQLTKANGATVDYQSLNLDLTDAKLEITGLGAADPNDLNKDRFYAQSVSTSINISNLLTRQITLKNVVVTGVALDKQRTTKAKLYIDTKPLTSEQSKISSEAIKQQAIETVGKLGEKLQQVDLQKLKENSQQAKDIANGIKQVAEFLSNFRSSDTESGQVSQEITPKAEAKVYGYANVKNEDLRDKYPSFVIQNIDIKDYKDAGTIYNANITNISTNPALLGLPTTITIKSTNNNDFDANIVISNKQNVDNTVKFNLQNITGNNVKGLTIQDVGLDAESLAVSGQGTWQFSGIRNITFNIPLQLKFNNVAVSFKQLIQNVSDLTLGGVISGDLNKPNLSVDASSLKNLLNVDTVKNVANQVAKQTGIDKKAQQVIIKDLNANDLKNINKKDVQNLASQFGITIN